MKRTSLICAVLLGFAVLTVGLSGPAAERAVAEPLPPVPAQDPFYAQPHSLKGARPGQVIASRPVTVTGIPTSTPFSAWQLKYVSEDTKGKPWTTIATLIRPARQAGPPKLMSFQPWIDALDSRCNPSYQLRMGQVYEGPTGMIAEMLNAAKLIDRGWTTVISDYLGPDNQFAAGFVEGRDTLDGIRAAENFAPAGLIGAKTPVALLGYSGGARATEFAAELAPKYAPELNLVGSAAGGLPGDMGLTAALINGGPFAGIEYSSSFGIARAYPELNIPALFADKSLYPAVSQMCQVQILATYAGNTVQDRTVNREWVMGLPKIVKVLDTLKAGRYGTPKSPLYLFQGAHDDIGTAGVVDRLVADYCTRKVPVTYARYNASYANHVLTESLGEDKAIDWIAGRFAHAPVGNTCGRPINAEAN
ncbi:MAG: hypothetical protein HOQ24_19415 [Mycobacteriaceae bacterium]|nr:hypothetical protein [Mycobacteriaceae bacterium]